MDVDKKITELEQRISRLEHMLQPSPLTIPLKTAFYIAVVVVGAYIATDIIYTFILKG